MLQGSAVLGCHVVNGVSGSFYACLRQSSSICTRQYSRTSKVANSAGRGFASGRDDEGLQASKESRSQEVLEGENTGTDNKRLLECKDPVTFARSSDDEAPKSSGQQESDIEQDAAGQQDPGQSLCKNHTTENEPGKQQRKQDDSSASGMVYISLGLLAAIPFECATYTIMQNATAHMPTMLMADSKYWYIWLDWGCCRSQQAGRNQRWRRDSRRTCSASQVACKALVTMLWCNKVHFDPALTGQRMSQHRLSWAVCLDSACSQQLRQVICPIGG